MEGDARDKLLALKSQMASNRKEKPQKSIPAREKSAKSIPAKQEPIQLPPSPPNQEEFLRKFITEEKFRKIVMKYPREYPIFLELAWGDVKSNNLIMNYYGRELHEQIKARRQFSRK